MSFGSQDDNSHGVKLGETDWEQLYYPIKLFNPIKLSYLS